MLKTLNIDHEVLMSKGNLTQYTIPKVTLICVTFGMVYFVFNY